MKQGLILFCIAIFLSCQSEKEKKPENGNNIYKPSEMAILMSKMYAKNAENKQLILSGEQPIEFPEEFTNIHTAKLTDPNDRTEAFKDYSDYYLSTLNKLFDDSAASLTVKHNNIINSCITCHKSTCLGPILKIKKLYIK